ncbi:GGDEF domain-containing protein [Thalassotalea euphylliae]|uniref:diguanylate cyclase n=1 Tax=Thalassotalea euphylliae TaxID=1655234 RepID=A0A3E0U373_9GAMM|nr:GGDEF domain-containing protein [Thalassotalea euphylliae]REL31431.1 GGDEF domain-containing protein [Thalassotalea euphylliae]
MKHHDSLAQAQVKMAKTLKLLAQWKLPATPINYAIGYEYICEKNTPLITKIDQHLFANNHLDNFLIEQLYQDHVLGQSNLRDDIFDDAKQLTAQLSETCHNANAKGNKLLSALDTNIASVRDGDKEQAAQALSRLSQTVELLKQQQTSLLKQLAKTEQQADNLYQEFSAARKEIYLDPVTRLYNRKALSKHFDTWVSESPDRQIAALVVSVDDFKLFSNKFGSLIGDVILSKIANKVSNYVGESGLPVRTGNEEFLILLPDVEMGIASEIAEKIRQGVEKIRFISSKSGIRLPQMTISLGVSEFKQKETLNSLLSRTQKALSNAQQKGLNQVSMLPA